MGRKERTKPAALDGVRMEITGMSEIIFEGNKGILAYSDEGIMLNTGKYIVSISGRRMRIKCMNESVLTICGIISEIRYIV